MPDQSLASDYDQSDQPSEAQPDKAIGGFLLHTPKDPVSDESFGQFNDNIKLTIQHIQQFTASITVLYFL